MYSSQLLDHFQNPRNPGEITDADAAAQIENPACGDVLLLTMQENGGRITEIKFKAKGCVAAMACGSAVTELVAGKTIGEAKLVSAEDVMAAVGGLPSGSVHGAHLAVETLSAALSRIKL
jgi:nitrogen fixation protein NifU and related proteins